MESGEHYGQGATTWVKTIAPEPRGEVLTRQNMKHASVSCGLFDTGVAAQDLGWFSKN